MLQQFNIYVNLSYLTFYISKQGWYILTGTNLYFEENGNIKQAVDHVVGIYYIGTKRCNVRKQDTYKK